MQRSLVQLPALQRQLCARHLSTTPPALSKASKQRTRKPKSFSAFPASSSTTPAAAQAGTALPGQAGTDAGRSGTGGLFESQARAQSPAEAARDPVGPASIEREFVEHQKVESVTPEVRENAGTDVRGDEPLGEGPRSTTAEPHEEVFYTAQPPYNVPLIMSAAFVVGVFCFVTADLARVGIADTGEYEVAPKWKRYTLAIGAAGVGTAAVAWGTLAPSRLVTKMTIRRNGPVNPSHLFPRDSVVSIYSPLTRLSGKLGQKPRQVPLSRIQLLGPLSNSPKPYHPLLGSAQKTKQGRIASLVDRFIPAPSKSKSNPTPWNKEGKRLSHSPILIEGDRASYSIALKRASTPDSAQGAWMKDWDQFERALLGVDEARWAKRRE
ncbi:hypothetical protein JCM10212_000654 [Sporobolomyces blumeae]